MIMGSSGRRLPGFLSRRHFLRHSGGGVMAAGAFAAAQSAQPLAERRPSDGVPVRAVGDEGLDTGPGPSSAASRMRSGS